MFPERNLNLHTETIKSLLLMSNSRTVLDFCAGKGLQHKIVWVKRIHGAILEAKLEALTIYKAEMRSWPLRGATATENIILGRCLMGNYNKVK